MKKRKIVYLAGLGLAASLALTGCKGSEKTVEESTEVEYKISSESLDFFLEGEAEKKVFEPYEHCVVRRYSLPYYNDKKNEVVDRYYIGRLQQGSVSVPEGYMIAGVSSLTDGGKYTYVSDVDVWFTNTKSVEVTPVYNEAINGYDYSEFGQVVELETEKGTEYTLK